MKKFISFVLAATMCLSLTLGLAVGTSAAVPGEWNVFTAKGQYKDPDNPEMKSIPGYEYTEEGLHMIPADWSTSSPWGILQTKEQVDLRQGVYMEVRVDDFTYEGDKWFGFNIWEEKIDEFPNEEDKQALGFEMLIRVNEDKTISSVQVNRHLSVGASLTTTMMDTSNVKDNFDKNGCPVMTLEIFWDQVKGYNVVINGATLNSTDAKEMTDFFDGPDNDGKAYVSFSLQNSIKGGTAECTVTKFGTSENDWTVPTGDDGARPINNTINIAPIEDPDNIPEGSPAVRIDGNTLTSDLLAKPGSTNNSRIVIKDDFAINVTTSSEWASIGIKVAHEVSYDVKDFPIVLIITRNLCTCKLTEEEPYCSCAEMLSLLAMTGDVIAESENYRKTASCMNWESDYDGEGNSYTYFMSDWTGYEGRINGLRIDVHSVKYSEAGRNTFDICEIGFFRTAREAEEYYMYYLTDRGVLEDTETDTETESDTLPSVEDTDFEETDPEEKETLDTDIEESVPSETEPLDTEPEEEQSAAKEDEKETEKVTEKTDTSSEDEKDQNSSEGCGSSIGAISVLVICTACAAGIVFKKKKR